MLHRNTEPETEPYYCLPIGSLSHWSQPTSPAPGSARTFPLSPTHSSTPRHSIPKNDDGKLTIELVQHSNPKSFT